MADTCEAHTDHTHQHGAGCGHTAIQHDGHTDYLHDGHMHHLHDGHVDEHRIAVSSANPDTRAPEHSCDGHGKDHRHAPGCGHEAAPHGDHTDYIVNGHLHHQQGAECHNHGPVKTTTTAKAA